MSRGAFAITVAMALAIPVGIAVMGGVVGCRHKNAPVLPDTPDTLVVKQDSEGLLLTWIDEKGDFHVEQKPADVPLVGRDAVRVVDPSRDEGTRSDKVFVADLRVAQADGSFPVQAMTRAEFEQFAVARRQKKGVALLPNAALSADGPSMVPGQQPNGLGSAASANGTNTRPQVVIYGASWCGACHDAAAYLRRKGISFIEKDVETDADAAREMKSKLAKSGLRGGSIPVLDVRGKIMVGFNPRSVEDALGKAI